VSDDVTLRPTPDTAADGLVPEAQAEAMRQRWREVQTRFVDDPRSAVGDADALVSDAIDAIRLRFDGHRSDLESRWQGGDEVSTEDLRRVLQDYRDFFARLVDAR
jgi:hypothetical protein